MDASIGFGVREVRTVKLLPGGMAEAKGWHYGDTPMTERKSER